MDYPDIKTFKDVLKYNNPTEEEWLEIDDEQIQSHMSKYMFIINTFIFITQDALKFTGDRIYYPYVFIMWDKTCYEHNEEYTIIPCKINNREAFLIGGHVSYSDSTSLGHSSSDSPISSACASIGWRGFSDRSVAQHISKYFSKELIEATVEWRTNEIKWV